MTVDYHMAESDSRYQYAHLSGYKVDYYYTSSEGNEERLPVKKITEASAVGSLIGDKIVGYSFHHASYKDRGSGPGFFGLFLQNAIGAKMWLTITIAGAGTHHMLLDGKWIQSFKSHINQFAPPLDPWHIQGYGLDVIKDDFTPFIQGCVIKSIDLQQDHCNITLTKDGQDHLLEILNTDPRLCPWPGATYKVGKETRYALPKAFPEGEHMGDYIVLIPEDGLIYV